MPRLRARLLKGVAITVNRIAIRADKIVYFILLPKPHRYEYGRSRIAYIGTSKRGIERVVQSVAQRAKKLLNEHGVRHFEVRIATCVGRQNVETWKAFESALLLRFRERYGEVPMLNTVGRKMKESGQFDTFTRKSLDSVLNGLKDG